MPGEPRGNPSLPTRRPPIAPEGPDADPRYVGRWRRLRWGLAAHFGAAMLWIPGGALLVSPWQPVAFVVIATLTLASLGGGAVLWTFRCPRCGKRFFDESITGQFDWVFRTRCAACQLRRGALVDPARFGRAKAGCPERSGPPPPGNR